jgi:hypothetical protein
VDDHLGRVRPGNQIGRADEIEKVDIAQPLPADHRFFAQHGNVCRRPTEGGDPELERDPGDLSQSIRMRFMGR